MSNGPEEAIIGGLKFDGGKVRLELLPPELLYSTATILTFGAEKYTVNYEEEWDALLDVSDVVGIKITTLKGDVVHVTKNNYDNLTLTTPNDKDRIVGIGRNAIQTRLRATPNVGKIVQSLVQETGKQNSWAICGNSALPNRYTLNSAKKDVEFADRKDTLTLTIVMKQGNFEVYFVPSATMVSDSWGIIWTDLKELYNISRPLNNIGDRNWELGMKWSRVFGAMMRHMWCWWGGKGPATKSFLFGELDDETGHSHLWHAACCLAFLITYEQRGVGEDDRQIP